MNRILSILTISLLSVCALASCDKSEERIGELEGRLTSFENDKLVSVTNQINGVSGSIADLESLRQSIRELIAASDSIGKDITSLKSADQLLSGRIDALRTYLEKELKQYAETDLVSATYATLVQYSAVNETIKKIRNNSDTLEQETANEINRISASISDWYGRLAESIQILTGKICDLDSRIQSISIVPANPDGSVSARYGLLTLKCVVSPASALSVLTKEDVSIVLGSAVTKAGGRSVISISDERYFQKDSLKGTMILRADVSSSAPAEGNSLIVAVNIKNGISDCTSKFVKAEYSAPTIFQKLRLAEAKFCPDTDGAHWELKLEKGDDALTKAAVTSYPTFTVRTKSAYSSEFLEGDFEIANAVLYTNSLESKEYTGGTMTVTCTSSDGWYDFEGTAVDALGQEYGFNPLDVKVTSTAATPFKDKAAADPSRISVSGVKLNVDEAVVELAREIGLTATVTPADATNGNAVWTSSDSTVATVGIDGKVKGVATGSAIITATTVDGKKSATCVVTVVTATVKTITLNKENLEISVGAAEQLVATVLPEDAIGRDVTWASTDESVATVDDTGNVTAVAVGSATIVAYTDAGRKSASCNVTVIPVRLENISFASNEYEVQKDATLQLSPIFEPENATDKRLVWTSSNTAVATVSSTGEVTGLAAGSTVVTATTEDGALTTNCTVTVLAPQPLPGVFSVSATGKVRFSRGNLKTEVDMQGRPIVWKFAVHQYDVVGNRPANSTFGIYPYPGEVDLFCWSTTAGEDNFGLYVYEGQLTASSSAGYSKGDFKDWGQLFGGESSPWRTLSYDEWMYLLRERTDASKKLGYAKVCGLRGVIVLPDNFTDPNVNVGNETTAFSPVYGHAYVSDDETFYSRNIYDETGWERMEQEGAVFLPFAGVRSKGGNVANGNSYWSSTPLDYSDSGAELRARNIEFEKPNNSGDYAGDGIKNYSPQVRNCACSVRLVTDVNE